jgi:hypothetical protein
MDYAAFKTYLRTFLWKQNDTDLANSLDSLVLMAHAELNRRLDIQRREITLLIEPETEDYELPADFRQIVSVNNTALTSQSQFSSTTQLDIYRQRQRTSSANIMPIYATAQGAGNQKILRLVGPFSPTDPGSLILIYRANVPDFAVTDASWLEADFLDLYTYTVLSHTAPFLREDERIAVWMDFKEKAIMSAIEEDKHSVSHGSPMTMRPHRKVP